MILYYALGLVNTVLNALTVFGLNLSSTKVGAIDVIVNAILLFIGAVFHIRSLSNNNLPPNSPLIEAKSKSTLS